MAYLMALMFPFCSSADQVTPHPTDAPPLTDQVTARVLDAQLHQLAGAGAVGRGVLRSRPFIGATGLSSTSLSLGMSVQVTKSNQKKLPVPSSTCLMTVLLSCNECLTTRRIRFSTLQEQRQAMDEFHSGQVNILMATQV